MESDEEGLSPDEAFRLLGDEMRTAILHAVWESSGEAVTFSEIRERAGSPDSGKFNYHLNKLAGHFLAKSEDGYRLTQAGREVVRAVMAGTITQRPEMDPVSIDAHCVDCGGALVARYDEYGIIECGDCGELVMWNEFPPAGLDGRLPEAFASVFDRWTRARFNLAMDGICPNCAHEMTAEILTQDSGVDDDLATMHRCENCKYEARVPLFGHIISHPAVVSFLYESGIDVTDMPYWRMQALARGFTEEVVSENPWTAKITIVSEGRELEVTLDEQLDVIDIERPAR
jgi:DNA-directed RNA polymerase subunit M/transcription elongation factor TFIIS